MADWEALFAQASDIPTSNSSSPKLSSSKRTHLDNDDGEDTNDHQHVTRTKKSKKKHKRQRTSKNSHDGQNGSSSSQFYQKMLQSRLDPPPGPSTPWFAWMTLTESFLDANTHYTMEGSTSSDSQTQVIHPSKLNYSPMSFRMALSNEQLDLQREYWHLQLFCHCRNLRCCAKLLAQWDDAVDGVTMNGKSTHNNQEKAKDSSKRQKQRRRQKQQHKKSLFRNMQHEANEIIGMTQSFLAHLPDDEANLLVSKASEATGLVEKLLRQRKREQKRYESTSDNNDHERSNVPLWSFELSIRIIMACDALYYRLYYQQLTGMIPIGTLKPDATNELLHIPHPQYYFGLEGLTMQSNSEVADRKNFSKSSRQLKSAQDLQDKSPELGALMDHLDAGEDGSNASNHPLEAIHRHRFKESMSLFQNSGWESSPKSLDQWKKSLFKHHNSDDPEAKHETPAPHLLMDWRDSCRDFLCHLYAYATISSTALQQLRDVLTRLQNDESIDLSKGIVEIGAGTGYLAEILRGQGMAVEAWDIQPTSTSSTGMNNGENRGGMNEYHGHVPSFCNVQKASTFPSTCDAKRSALLLCYPPPGSPMALNTLSAYRKAGGKCLIHIGEFKGLTGDFNFEKALLKGSMRCVARYPCLGWGTDAAYVTIWTTKGLQTKELLSSPSVLLPCTAVNCTKESTRRCRAYRQIVYCCKECFDKHESERNCLLSLYNVHTDPSITSFVSSKAFVSL